MSLSNFYFGDLEEDPIFGHQMRSMRQMQNHMNNMLTDPFGMMGMGMGMSMMPFGAPMIQRHQPTISPFGGMNLNRLLSSGMDGGVSYSSSSVFSVMAPGPDGRAQVYQETSSTKTGPGGVKETRRTVQDSSSGTKKMAIGHHIGERARVVEKEQNMHTGHREEREELINLDESDTEEFERDFQQKVSRHIGGRQHRLQIEEVSSEPLLAIQSSEDIQQRNRLASSRRAIRTPTLSPLALPSSRHDTTSVHPHPYNPQSRKNRGSKMKGQSGGAGHH